ncbi:MAG: helix-turn-helix domain-containing protein [Patescibacteria group bacterium]|jgi:sugar-specific transcriptional regulator TrmB
MNHAELIKILQNIGLSENEAKVYCSALSLGSSTILNLARNASMKRSTVYAIVEALKQKGLMHIKMQGLKKLYTAANPEQLEHILEQRQDNFKKHLPDFLAIYNLESNNNFVKYYEGLTAVKALYEDSLKQIKPHEDYLVITNQEQWLQLDEKFFMNYIKKRAKLNINTRLLFQDSPIAREHKRLEKNFNEQVKILPAGTALEIDLVLIPNRLIIHQLIPPIMAIVIENKSVIKMQQELFEIIWRSIN